MIKEATSTVHLYPKTPVIVQAYETFNKLVFDFMFVPFVEKISEVVGNVDFWKMNNILVILHNIALQQTSRFTCA